jgi:hypothetical protein
LGAAHLLVYYCVMYANLSTRLVGDRRL